MTNRGYTLIELSIVMAIVGILVAGGLAIYMDKSESLKYRQTLTTMRTIEEAIGDFYSVNGFLPCPANGDETATGPLFGIAVAYDTNSSTCNNPNTDAAMLTEPRGVVPVRSIGLADSYAYDGWGRKISYAVSPGLGSRSDFSSTENKGVIQVINSSGIRVTNLEYGAAYALISHGRNGSYAFLNTGGDPYIAAAGGIEAQNASVADNTLVMGPLANNFDDIVQYRTKAETHLIGRLVRPLEIQKITCTNARTIVDYGISQFLASSYGSAYPDHANKIYQVAIAIDRLCQQGGPKNSGSRTCIPNLVWLDNDSATPRAHADCYCPGDIETTAAENMTTSYDVQNFGGCQ